MTLLHILLLFFNILFLFNVKIFLQHDKLEFPDHMGKDCRDFLGSLLNRNPQIRLGYNGVEEIKAHQYFSNIDWELLDAKKLEPPYKPDVDGVSFFWFFLVFFGFLFFVLFVLCSIFLTFCFFFVF